MNQKPYRSFEVSNFKTFDYSKGSRVDIEPITFLIGANGSGKSSFVKSYVLFDKLLSNWKKQYNDKKDIVLADSVLDFSDRRLKLGSYKYIRNENLEDKLTCFSYEDGSSVPHKLDLYIEAFDEDREGRLVVCQINCDNWGSDFSFEWNLYEKTFKFCIGDLVEKYLDYKIQEAYDEIERTKRISEEYNDNEEIIAANNRIITAETEIISNYKKIKELYSSSITVMSFPFLSVLCKETPTEFRTQFFKLVENSLSEEDTNTLEQFVSEFEQSNYDTFEEFIIIWEYNNLLQGIATISDNDSMINTAIEAIRVYLSDNDVFNALSNCTKSGNKYFKLNDYLDFCSTFLAKALIPACAGNLVYHESVHDVSRSYNYNQGDENYFNIAKLYIDRNQAISKNSDITYSPGSFSRKWIRKFGIGEDISIDRDNNTNSISISIRQKGLKFRPLADEGLGVNCIVMLLLEIENAIMGSLLDGQEKTIILEEPESHLHPRWQSMVTDILLNAYKSRKVHFLVETHSEYMIRKSQVLAKGMESIPFGAFYFPGDSDAYSLEYQSDGHFKESFGPGFLDETTKLIEELL